MDKKRIATFSLLAHINNSKTGINDLGDIFIPLVKRVLSQMNYEGYNRGASLNEIKIKVDELYRLDIPFPLLKKMVTKIAAEENQEGDVNFEYFKDGSFLIKNFVFADYEEVIQDQEYEIEFVQESYESFLKINNIDVSSQPTIFEFLDSNRLALSQYFANKVVQQPTIEFSHQANFINSVKDIPKVYNILRKIYLGSMITSYLEVDYGDLKKDVEFLVDTNFIVGLLDLNSIESTHTCRKIVEICQRLGYKLSILDFTIEETEALLSRTAENYDVTFLAKKIDPESIYNACDRRKLKKTDLQLIASGLKDTIFREYKIDLIPNTTKYRNEAKFSPEYKKFKEIRTTEFSALHDATALIYVQKKRGKRISNFQDSNCWFVTNVSHALSHFKENKYLPEIIRAEDLVNLLWLTNPLVKTDETVELGLTRLVSCAISNSLPSARVIKELDENIQKYASDKVDARDIVRVANVIANKTIINLEQLNKTARENPEEFVRKLQRISDKEKSVEATRKNELKDLLLQIREDADAKLKETIEELKSEHSKNLDLIRTTLQDEFTKKLVDQQMIEKQNQLDTLIKAFEPLQKVKDSYDNYAEKNANWVLFFIIVVPIILVCIIYFKIGWSNIEPWTFLLAFVPSVLSYLYFAIKKKDFSIKSLWEDLKENRQTRYYSKHNFDISQYEESRKNIEDTKREINNIPNR
ncbi:MAG: hypothetical protein AB9888_17600 [Bacteroidales bacterium]